MTTLQVSALLLGIFSIKLVDWNPHLSNATLWILFSIFGYFTVRAIINGNIVILLACFMMFAFWAIQNNQGFLAGLLFALVTIKPQIALLIILGILIWAWSHRNWELIRGIIFWILILTIIGMLMIPNWIIQNLSDILRYPSYTEVGTVQVAVLELLPKLGIYLNWILTAALLIWLLITWKNMLQKPFEHFLFAMCITLVISQWVGIQTDPGNFIILNLPLALIFAQIQKLWKHLASFGIGTAIIFLLFGLWILFLLTVRMGEQPTQSPIMFFTMPPIVMVGLWLVREKFK
jgi:hypothetical protein